MKELNNIRSSLLDFANRPNGGLLKLKQVACFTLYW